jgi:hypothetical protein
MASHDVDVRRAVEDALETFAHDGVVVCNDYANHGGVILGKIYYD